MIVLICYDIVDDKRRRKVFDYLSDIGIGAQKSVFECDISEEVLDDFKNFCRDVINEEEDSIRIYRVCEGCVRRVITFGTAENIWVKGYEII